MTRAAVLVTALALAFASTPAEAKPKDPKALELAVEGNKRFTEGDFEGAREAFEKGYKIEPDPVFLYGMGQALNQLGDCKGAIRKYKKVEESPVADPELRQLAQAAIYACADKLASDESDPPPPIEDPVQDDPIEEDPVEEDPVGTPIDDTSTPPDDYRRPWVTDVAGWVLTGVGVGGAAAGGALLGIAQVEDGKEAASYEEFDERQRKVRNYRIGGGVALGVGAGLIIGGAVHFVVYSQKKVKPKAAFTPYFDGRSAGLGISGRF